MYRKLFILLLFLSFLCSFQGKRHKAESQSDGQKTAKIKVTSTVFGEGKMIPQIYACNGKSYSPPVKWSGAPDGTKSLVLIMDDPDAPLKTFVHWVVYNIPPEVNGFDENMPADKVLKNGANQGMNDVLKIGYTAVCPPTGTHRYFIKVYALDTKLNLEDGATKEHVVRAMKGHVLAEGQLMGKYKR